MPQKGTCELKQCINNFKLECEQWNIQLRKHSDSEVVFNKNLETIEKDEVKYILVADNPGGTEKELNEYLVGDAGIVTRLFFERFLVSNFDKQVIVLNKTPISTAKTKDLIQLNTNKCNILFESQKYMASLTYNISMLLSVPAIIMGFSGCRRSNGVWDLKTTNKKAVGLAFFKQLEIDFNHNPENLYIVKHFSRNSFFADFNINNYRENSKEHFFNIGCEYRKELLNHITKRST